MSRYDTKTGLQCTSDPRRFSVQAISSSAATSIPSACCSCSALRMRDSFDLTSSPASSIGCISTGFRGTCGRSLHILANGSKLVRTVIPPCCRKASFISSTTATVFTIPSMPISVESGEWRVESSEAIHSAMVGVPAILSRISWNSVPLSCSAACMK